MLILLFLGVILAWFIQHTIYKRRWNKGLDVTLSFMDSYAYEGDTSYLKQEIVNDKMLPIPALEVRFSTNRNLEMQGEARENTNVSDQSYQREVFALWGRQKVIRKIPFICRKRGYYHIKKSEIVGYNLLYSYYYYMECEQETSIYVYPGRVDVKRIRLLCQAISGAVLARRKLYPDPFEFSGIREYQRTDPMNLINWKASAKTGSLMVNQQDSTTNVQVVLLMDVEDSNILKYEELVEESIRITSSLAGTLISQGMEFDILSNGMEAMHLKSGAGLMQELNQKLACVEVQKVSEEICSVIEESDTGKTTDRIFVIISKNYTEHNRRAAEALVSSGNQVLWVLPVHPYMQVETRDYPGMQVIQWEVG